MMDWKLTDEYAEELNDMEEHYEKIIADLNRKKEIEVQLRKGQNHV